MNQVLTPGQGYTTAPGRWSGLILRRTDARSKLALLTVWLAAGAYGYFTLRHGWVPHDDGALAQSANRVLAGEMPHRDFDEIYTGALSYFNAAGFQVFGAKLISLRYLLLAAYLAWIPVVYRVARRFSSPLVAGGVTLLCAVWSIPMYPAAIPSWYILFLSTAAAAALLSHAESGRVSWLVIAGLCGGGAVLCKTTGLYTVAAGIFYGFYREQADAVALKAGGPGSRRYTACLCAVLALFVGLICALVAQRWGTSEVVHFVAPPVSVAGVLLAQEWRISTPNDSERFRRLISLVCPFLLGCLIVITPFVAAYAVAGAAGELSAGIRSSLRRLVYAGSRPPPAWTVVLTFLVGTYIVFLRQERAWGYRAVACYGLAVAALLLVLSYRADAYLILWLSAANGIPVLVVSAALAMGAAGVGKRTAQSRLQLQVLLTVLAFWSLNQYPFSAPIYFVYTVPLLALTLLSVLSEWPRASKPYLGALLVMAGVFGVVRAQPGFIYVLGHEAGHDAYTADLGMGQGGIRVTPADRETYPRLVQLLRQHARGGRIWAGPDAPEVYFLAGFTNPTRSIFEFLGSESPDDQLRKFLPDHHLRAVVINSSPEFSPPITSSLQQELATRFPFTSRVGRFIVRWAP